MIKENMVYKIIIDTNIWISFLIGKTLKGLEVHIHNNKIKIVTCVEQKNELLEVLSRSRIRKYLNNTQIVDFLDLFEFKSEDIIIQTQINICRDPKDNYLLNLAIDSKADYLITGDKDLLELNQINNTKIISYREFNSIELK